MLKRVGSSSQGFLSFQYVTGDDLNHQKRQIDREGVVVLVGSPLIFSKAVVFNRNPPSQFLLLIL